MTSPIDLLVVGGGPAGSTAAALSASRGKRVVLIERTPEPQHKVCGEFLSHEALSYLRALGLEPEGLGAIPIRRMRLATDHVIAEVELPFEAMSLSRKVMDTALLSLAREHGAFLLTGRQVEHLTNNSSHWTAVLNDGQKLHSSQVMLATGKHDLRGYMRDSGQQNRFIAFKMHMQLSAEQANRVHDTVEVVLFPGGYLGLQPVGAGVTNLCFVVRNEVMQAVGGGWAGALRYITSFSSHVQKRLQGAQELLSRPVGISRIPYGYLRRKTQNGLWALSDQAAVIPSFSGDGMAIAFHSAYLAAMFYASERSAIEYTRELHNQLRPQVMRASLLSDMIVYLPRFIPVLKYFPFLLRRFARTTRISEDHMISESFALRSYA